MEFNVFESIKIGLASPEKIREWSYGEVKKPETINYRTLKPERDGLFCERIFGPTKDWECYCGKYKRLRYKGKICERCGVEVTKSKVRRERMGHIELAAPVSHIWYFKGTSSRMGLLLNLSPRLLEKVLYFASYIVTDPGTTNLKKYTLLSEKEYRDMREAYEDEFEAMMGAEAIKKLLEDIDLEQLSRELKDELETLPVGQKRARILKRLEVVEAFRLSGNQPSWMILDVVPVIPPDIRPMVQLDGGRFATSDLNDLYRRVINRNNRLKKLIELGAPDIIVRNEKRMLQESVDALIDNGRHGRPVTGPNNRPLKSLSDMLKGKQGRFRQNLLGKRVDYSGRSVIVVGPDLKMYQCGLPKEMALELFKPFVMKRLVDQEIATNIKNARKMVDRASMKEVWDALEVVIKNHPVLLNRAPTLHRLGIQAFEPILVEGRAIRLHPLVCTAFNADFDGDQMAIHLPLSAEAQAEARFLMLAAGNLLKPSDGRPVTIPTQDMILGSYYLTMVRDDEPGAGKVFRNFDEAKMAYDTGVVGLHAPIKVRVSREVEGKTISRLIDATVGQIIFNDPIPQDLGFVDRTDSEKQFDLEVTFLVRKKQLGQIIDRCIRNCGTVRTSEILDRIKNQGFKYSTKSGLTVAVSDALIPENKQELIAQADEKVAQIKRQYDRGLISDDVRYDRVIKVWNDTTEAVKKELNATFGERNPIYMFADSGARGSMEQIRQLAGMRGLIANTSGKAIEIPIKSNYREGLNILEYFQSSRGARKGLADTALRTADSGYLTRRLVDVSQDVIVRSDDCGTHEGIMVYDITDSGRVIESLAERLTGRYLADDLVDPKTGEVLAMVSLPVYDPQNITDQVRNSSQHPFWNRALQGTLPPGSTFKIITAAAALENLPDAETHVFTCTGATQVMDHVVHDYNMDQHGDITLDKAFRVSCNNAFAQAALMMGDTALRRTAEAFGFNDNFLFRDLVVENSVYPTQNRNSVEIAWSGAGQSQVVATPMHMCMVAAAIANDGVMMEPRLLSLVESPTGKVRLRYSQKVYRTACSPEMAQIIDGYMKDVVKSGTGTRAQVSGLTIAGKTGSAEGSDNGMDVTHAWFVGYIDSDQYPYAISVLVENGGSGGSVAAPSGV